MTIIYSNLNFKLQFVIFYALMLDTLIEFLLFVAALCFESKIIVNSNKSFKIQSHANESQPFHHIRLQSAVCIFIQSKRRKSIDAMKDISDGINIESNCEWFAWFIQLINCICIYLWNWQWKMFFIKWKQKCHIIFWINLSLQVVYDFFLENTENRKKKLIRHSGTLHLFFMPRLHAHFYAALLLITLS